MLQQSLYYQGFLDVQGFVTLTFIAALSLEWLNEDTINNHRRRNEQ